MKYLVMLGDGMADRKIKTLDNKTPLEVAYKPTMDFLAQNGRNGLVMTVPENMVPESDTANLAVLGYDPNIYSKGRSPLEAMSMGLSIKNSDYAFRCNLVTLTDDEPYEKKIITDHSSDEISTAEADELIRCIQEKFGTDVRRFYTGISYRHCMLWDNPPGYNINTKIYDFTRPHDILGKIIGDYLPKGEIGEAYLQLMKESYYILKDHPVNINRIKNGKRPANSLWIWSPGKKPQLSSFKEKFNLNGCIISAVDLIKGIGKCASMYTPDVVGATGTLNTNYSNKAKEAINAFEAGNDFVYIHVEAPDECGHRGEEDNKVKSIEYIDKFILSPVKEWLDKNGEDYKILLLPDHYTPIEERTHTHEPVPFVIYDSREVLFENISSYSEENAAKTSFYIAEGYKLIDIFLNL